MTHSEFNSIEKILKIYKGNRQALERILEFLGFMENNPHAHIEIIIKSGEYEKDLDDYELAGFMPILKDFLSTRKQEIKDDIEQLSIIAQE